MILLVCILYTLEGEHEDIPGHSIRGLEDFSLIASCLLAFKQFQIVCVCGYMLGTRHQGLVSAFLCGNLCPWPSSG